MSSITCYGLHTHQIWTSTSAFGAMSKTASQPPLLTLKHQQRENLLEERCSSLLYNSRGFHNVSDLFPWIGQLYTSEKELGRYCGVDVYCSSPEMMGCFGQTAGFWGCRGETCRWMSLMIMCALELETAVLGRQEWIPMCLSAVGDQSTSRISIVMCSGMFTPLVKSADLL